MKILQQFLVFLVSACLILYLIGCFAQASFNIKEWSEIARGTIAVCMGFVFLVVGGMFSDYARGIK